MDRNIFEFPTDNRLRAFLNASPFWAFIIILLFNGIACSKTLTKTNTKYQFKSNLPKCPKENLALNFPVAGLFIGISNYDDDRAKVFSTPAHTISAALFQEQFHASQEVKDLASANESYFGNPKGFFMEEYNSPIRKALFIPNSSSIASINASKEITIWNTKDSLGGYEVNRLRHEDAVNDIDISSNGKFLASASEDQTAKIWRLPEGNMHIKLPHSLGVKKIRISKNGALILTVDNHDNTFVWDMKKGDPIPIKKIPFSEDCQGMHSLFNKNSLEIITIGCHFINIWPLEETDKPRISYKTDGIIFEFSVDANGSFVMTRDFNRIQVWRTDLEGEPFTIEDDGKFMKYETMVTATLSPDGNKLAAAYRNGTIKLWHLLESPKEYIIRNGAQKKARMIEKYGPGGFSPRDYSIEELSFVKGGQQLLAHWKRNAPMTRYELIGDWNDIGPILYFLEENRKPERLNYRGKVITESQFDEDGKRVVFGFADGKIDARALPLNPAIKISKLARLRLLADLSLPPENPYSWGVESILGGLKGTYADFHDPLGNDDRYRNTDGSWNYIGLGKPVDRRRIFHALEKTLEDAVELQSTHSEVLLFIYVSAHGLMGDDGKPYLLPSEASAEEKSSWIAYEEFLKPIIDYLNRPGAQNVRAIVVFDTCQFQTPDTKIKTLPKPLTPKNNLLILTSTSPGQYSFHWTDKTEIAVQGQVESKSSRAGISLPEKSQPIMVKRNLGTTMSVLPISSSCALSSLIKFKEKQPNDDPLKMFITIWNWISDTIFWADQKFLQEIPEKEKSQLKQEMARVHGHFEDFRLFRIIPGISRDQNKE